MQLSSCHFCDCACALFLCIFLCTYAKYYFAKFIRHIKRVNKHYLVKLGCPVSRFGWGEFASYTFACLLILRWFGEILITSFLSLEPISINENEIFITVSRFYHFFAVSILIHICSFYTIVKFWCFLSLWWKSERCRRTKWNIPSVEIAQFVESHVSVFFSGFSRYAFAVVL